jgi:hypothetical protein
MEWLDGINLIPRLISACDVRLEVVSCFTFYNEIGSNSTQKSDLESKVVIRIVETSERMSEIPSLHIISLWWKLLKTKAVETPGRASKVPTKSGYLPDVKRDPSLHFVPFRMTLNLWL